MKKLIAAAVAVVGTFRLFATDIVWQGPTEGEASWTNTANWVGGVVPGNQDCAIFGADVGTLSVSTDAPGELPFHDITVMAGKVTLGEGFGTQQALRVPVGTNVMHVAENALLIFECSCLPPNGGVDCNWRKTGKGVFQGPKYNGKNFGDTGWSRFFRVFHVVEGKVTFPGYRVCVNLAVVEDGARYEPTSISTMHGLERFEPKAGGTVYLGDYNSNNPIAGFLGEGTVEWASGSTHNMTLYNGPMRFNGILKSNSGSTVVLWSNHATYNPPEENRKFIVGGAETLKNVPNLKANVAPIWGAGVGEFWMGNIKGAADVPIPEGGVPILTEDEAGEPIRLHTGTLDANAWIRGPGEWFASKTMSITGAQVRVTGAIGADTGATLTIGDGTDEGAVDLSASAGLVANGTVTLTNGAAVTVVGSVSGAGTLNVSTPLDVTNSVSGLAALNVNAALGVKGPLSGLSKMNVNAPATFEGETDLPTTLSLSAATTFAGPISKIGNITANADVEFLDVRATSIGTITLKADVTLKGHGQFAVHDTPSFQGGSLSVFDLGLDGGWRTDLNGYDSPYTTKKRGGRVYFKNVSSPDSALILGAGGSWRQGDGNNSYFSHVVLKDGGRMILQRDGGFYAYPTEAGRLIESDGGVIEICPWQSLYGFSVVNSAEVDYWTLKVGTKGHRYDYRGAKGQNCCGSSGIYNVGALPRAESAVTGGRDGGIVFAVGGRTTVSRPQSVTGPVRLADGAVVVASGAVADVEGHAFGSGDLVMDGAWLAISYSDADLGLKLAGGEGAKFRLESPSHIELSTTQKSTERATLNTPQTITIGPEGGEGSPIVREKGGVLFVSNFKSGSVLDGTTGKLLVNGPVETYADGRVKLPVFAEICFIPYFMAYDTENGFVKFTNCVSAVTDADSQKAVDLKATDGKTVIAAGEEKSIGGIRFTDNKDDSNTFVELKAGSVLHVGDGVNPGVVMYGGGYNGCTPTLFTGDGTVDFGTSEGVFAIGERSNMTWSPKPVVKASIAGSSGVTFASAAGADDTYLTLNKPSTYTGGTIIGNLAVTINDGAALGRDAVKVCDGNVSGGSVRFGAAMTVENDFEVAGHGIRVKNPNNNFVLQYGMGALWFAASGVRLTGDVAMGEDTRFTAFGAPAGADSGIFEGVISGGHLQISYAQEAPIVFTKPNTYTGGTEIVSAAVTLRGAGTLGPGDVLLDQGVLRFENDEEVTFTNYVRGKGVFQLAGTAPVHFRGDYSDIESAAVDLAGTRQVFTELPPFATITNSAATRATFVLAENLGTVVWGDHELVSEKEFDIEIGEGTLLDLGGATLRVRRARNGSAKRVVNGEFIESKPEQGVFLLVR